MKLPVSARRGSCGGVPCLALTCALTGCAALHAPRPVDAVQPIGPSFIDLEPGWRLRVVTPLLRSGGYVLKSNGETSSANTVTISAGADFLGYEVAYYAVSRNGVSFGSAETTKDGHTVPQAEPVARLFQLPRGIRRVRLIYLVRVSQADHDMAVAAAKNMEDLQDLTQRVQADPANACRVAGSTFCAWIPRGIAVAPQVQRKSGGAVDWVPAR